MDGQAIVFIAGGGTGDSLELSAWAQHEANYPNLFQLAKGGGWVTYN